MKTYNPTAEILGAMFCKNSAPLIDVLFDGQTEAATYTANIIELLKTDSDVLYIIDHETGELLFYRD